MKVRSLVLGRGQARVEEVPRPEAEPGWVVVRTAVAPICGSDRGAFLMDGESRWAGHEGTGIVEEAAPGGRLKPGDRVVIAPQAACGECARCREGHWIYCLHAPPSESHFREYVKKQDSILPILPEDLSLELGSLAGCALCPGFEALERMQVGAFDTVLVVGLGPVGLGTVGVASFRGARVLGVEPEPFRRELAAKLGAEAVFDPGAGDTAAWVRDMTDGLGATCTVECSGTGAGLRLCIDAAARLGRVGVVGENHDAVPFGPSDDFIRKGLTVVGTWFMNWLNYERVFDLLRRKPVLAEIITHRFPFERAQEAFETFLSGRAGKVLLTFPE